MVLLGIDRTASKTPTPIPQSTQPEAQPRLERSQLIQELFNELEEDCEEYFTQDIQEMLWKVRRDKAAALDAEDRGSEVRLILLIHLAY